MKRTVFSLFACALTVSVSFAQTTWHVDASATPPGNGSAAQPYADLQFALSRATTVSGDTLLVEPGTYVGAIDFLGKNVTVQSTQGPAVTILDGNDQFVSVVSFVNGESSNAVLDGFTVTRGWGVIHPPVSAQYTAGGGILCANSSPSLRNLSVTSNRARWGAGILLDNAPALISHCSISANGLSGSSGSHQGAGLWSNSSTAVVEFCTIAGNIAGVGFSSEVGGGFHGTALVRDCEFRNNRTTYGAGAYSTGATFQRCLFDTNTCQAQSVQAVTGGGAIFGHSGLTTAIDCAFVNNLASHGGAVGRFQSTALSDFVVRRSSFIGNRTYVLPGGNPSQGGAAFNVRLEDCELSANRAAQGGGLYGGSATRCSIYGNWVSLSLGLTPAGGGAHVANLIDCDVFDNLAEDGNAAFPFSSIAQGGGSFGGTAVRTRFTRNRAQQAGGACGGVLTNCTFDSNEATVDGGSLSSTPWVFGGNSLQGANLICRGGVPNEIAVVGTATASIRYSDIQGGFAGIGNFDADPLYFAPLSRDYHLKFGSPCIDAGDPASPLDPDGTRADVGAHAFDVNYCSAPGVWCAGKPNSLGCVPEMGFTGTPSASGADNFFVTGSNFLGSTFGLLAWSRTPNTIPFQNGTLCLQGPFFRAGLQVSSGNFGACDGTYSFHFSQSYRALFGINTLDTIYAQWFARDALNPDGTGWSLSNAIEFTVCP